MILKFDYSPPPVKKRPNDNKYIEFPNIIKKIPILAIIKVMISAYFLPKLSAKNVKKINPVTLPIKSGTLKFAISS